jgi:hypothetical protein
MSDYDPLSDFDYWRLADELSVVDAAFLTMMADPGDFELVSPDAPLSSQIRQIGGFEYVGDAHKYDFERVESDLDTVLINPAKFRAIFKALRNAIIADKLKARITNLARTPNQTQYEDRWVDYPPDEGEEVRNYGFALSRGIPTVYSNSDSILCAGPNADRKLYILTEPDWHLTTIEVEDLREWFRSKEIAPPFFFPRETVKGYMDKSNPRYSPKLATAIAAWETVKSPGNRQSVKQTLKSWIISNGVNFGLGNKSGVVSDHVAEEVAIIANWRTGGGATPTPSGAEELDSGVAPEVQNFDKVEFDQLGYGGPYTSSSEDDPEIPF